VLTAFTATASAADDRRTTLSQWLANLNDRDAAVRATARRDLMGINADELPLLQEVAVAAKPLKLAQGQALREIVIYVRARKDLLAARLANSRPFMGIRYPADTGDFSTGERGEPSRGIPVQARIPGFVGYRYLEDGDILLAMGPPDAVEPLRSGIDLLNAVRSVEAGSLVELQVQRGAAVVTVRFVIDASPAYKQPDEITAIITSAENAGVEYWDTHFAALFPDEPI
jgi:hypothetical protein